VEGDVPTTSGRYATLPQAGVDLRKYLAEVEQKAIEKALENANGIVQKAADLLGVGRTTLVEKIKRFEAG
jgi:sigma-54 specific flagellar transcriptional regulator A